MSPEFGVQFVSTAGLAVASHDADLEVQVAAREPTPSACGETTIAHGHGAARRRLPVEPFDAGERVQASVGAERHGAVREREGRAHRDGDGMLIALVREHRSEPRRAVELHVRPDRVGRDAGERAEEIEPALHLEPSPAHAVLEAGAAGYLMKNAADRELVDAVRAVARGDMFIRPSAAKILARRVTKKDPLDAERARFERLTDREQNVLRLTAQGYSAPEIGEKLFISPKTVDTYKQRIGDKLGLTHRAEYIAFALKLGLLQEGAEA